MKTGYYAAYLLCAFLVSVTSCNNDATKDSPMTASQSFTVAVASIGENFNIETRRPISSVSPTQTFDKLSLIIVKNEVPAQIVYKTTLNDWSNTANIVSTPWSNENGEGRKATITLNGTDCLKDEHSYIVYAIGYESNTYGNYEPFKGLEAGDNYNQTETATVPLCDDAHEIFAGAEIFIVKDGKIYSQQDSESGAAPATIVLRRQVAGTFGYFTDIPTHVGDSPVAKLRLVATQRNQTVIFGGFRGLEDPLNFNKENVVNGTNPRTDYDAQLAHSQKKDAFVVYEIDLSKWFPGNTDSSLPLDINGDGLLNGLDKNWRIDAEKYPEGSLSLLEGSVFGDAFWIAVAISKEALEKSIPTFQMQLTNENDGILKYWNVQLRDTDEEETRTIVTLPDDGGRAIISIEKNPDTDYCYSIVRNRLYTMGEKSHSQNYGEDSPINLNNVESLVLDSNHEWNMDNIIIF